LNAGYFPGTDIAKTLEVRSAAEVSRIDNSSGQGPGDPMMDLPFVTVIESAKDLPSAYRYARFFFVGKGHIGNQ
jgi:hypothetical protein